MLAAEQISRYPVLQTLGSGGMGRVYLARDPDLDREIALKVLRETDEDRDAAVARLRGEARAVAALRHPNIVTVYEIGDDGERAFIAMEYIDGASLRARIDAGIETAELLGAGAKIARALEAAHAAGVLHRDIKPDNVMIDSHGIVKVVDFGIAHRLDGETNALPDAPTRRVDAVAATIADTIPQSSPDITAHTIFGTPAYMAPEVVVGQPPLPASDVYSLGVLLYEGLAGQLPYSSRGVLESLMLVADPDQPFAPLAQRRPELAPEVVALVESMLAHEPADRPDAAQIAARLETLAAPTTEPIEVIRTVQAPPAPRSRTPWLLAGVAVLAAAAAVIGLVSRENDPGADRAAATPTPTTAPIRVAIDGVAGDFSHLGHANLNAHALARVIARALESTPSIEPMVLDPADGAPSDAARAAGAARLLSSEIEIGDGEARGRFALVDLDSGETRRGEVKAADLAGIIAKLSHATLDALGIAPTTSSRKTSARVNYELGLGAYRRETWASARLFLEQAVRDDPALPGAWFYLAWARAWAGAAAELSREAARRARETARTDLERGLGAAMVSFLDQRYRETVATLAPLLEKHPRDRDLLYTYAEALYHDGRIDDSLAIFDRCLEVAPRFLPAARHPRQVAVAEKNASAFRRYQTLADKPYEGRVAYFGGDDAAAERAGFSPWWMPMLQGNYGKSDRENSAKSSASALAYIMGRAVMLGTEPAARKQFAAAWPTIAKAAEEPRGAFDLQILARALIIGGYTDEVATVRAWWEEHQTPVNLMARQELAVFSAPVLDRPLPPIDELTTRLGAVAIALEDLRNGRSAQAADRLGALAAKPDGRGGDFVIWHAWARALRAAGRRDKLREACERWRRPGFADHSIIALWAYCDRALR